MLCIKLVNYWDKYTEMHAQQNVKKNFVMGLSHIIWHLWIRSKRCTYFVMEIGMSRVYYLVDCVQLKLLPVVWNSSLFSFMDQNQLKHSVRKNTQLNSLQQSNQKELCTAYIRAQSGYRLCQ